MGWSGRAPAPPAISWPGAPRQGACYARRTAQNAIAVVGIDIGKNSLHIVALDDRGGIVLGQKWSRSQIEAHFSNKPPCLIGMQTKGQKNDFRDAEAIAEAVQRPTMKFVTTKTADRRDLQALHRGRERLVSQRTGIINQIRAFLLERRIAVRQGQRLSGWSAADRCDDTLSP